MVVNERDLILHSASINIFLAAHGRQSRMTTVRQPCYVSLGNSKHSKAVCGSSQPENGGESST